MSSIVKVNPIEMIDLIELAAKYGKAVMIWGLAGVGKSAIIAGELADRLKVKRSNVLDIRLTTKDNIDLRGLTFPNEKTGRTETFPPQFLPPSDSEETYLIFLDEANLAEPSVQKAAYQLVLDHKIDEYVLPKNTIIILAGNTDEAGGMTFPMPRPLTNRMIHAELVMDLDHWKLLFANNYGIHPLLLAFLENYQDLLNGNHEGVAFPSSRTWTALSDMLWDMKFFNIMTKLYKLDPQVYISKNFPYHTEGDIDVTQFGANRNLGSKQADYDRRMLEITVTSAIGNAVGHQFIAMLDSLLDVLPTLDNIFDDSKDDRHDFDLTDSTKVYAFSYILGSRIKAHLTTTKTPTVILKKFLDILFTAQFSSVEFQIAFWMNVNQGTGSKLSGLIVGTPEIRNSELGQQFCSLIKTTAQEITI
jgi:hypothetical protein